MLCYRAVGGMIFTLVWPIFPLIMQVIVFAYFLWSTTLLASTGRAEYYRNDTGILSAIPCDPQVSSVPFNFISRIYVLVIVVMSVVSRWRVYLTAKSSKLREHAQKTLSFRTSFFFVE